MGGLKSYLHEVLDKWFAHEVKVRLKGRAFSTSSVTLQENRFKDRFRAKRKQKKPTDVGISVQDLSNPFFVTGPEGPPGKGDNRPEASIGESSEMAASNVYSEHKSRVIDNVLNLERAERCSSAAPPLPAFHGVRRGEGVGATALKHLFC
jgi:hypothetical protein